LLFRSRFAAPPYAGPAWWKAAISLAVALFAQVELLHFALFRNAELSAVFIVVIWYATHADVRRAAIFGLIAGLCEDLLSTHTGAAFTISTMLAAAIAGTLSGAFFADSVPLGFIVMFLSTLVRNAFFWSIMALEGYPSGFARIHLHQTAWQALLNAAVLAAAMVALRAKDAFGSR
jgi:rod shape-determining protein MreD